MADLSNSMEEASISVPIAMPVKSRFFAAEFLLTGQSLLEFNLGFCFLLEKGLRMSRCVN